MLDRSDPRAALASYGAPTAAPPAGQYAPAEYVKFYDTAPQEKTENTETWFGRGQNFVVAYSNAKAGARFTRRRQPDEYVLLLPDAASSVEATTAGSTSQVAGYSVTVVPPGDSDILVKNGGRLVRLFSVRSEDLVEKCSNADSYRRPHPNVAVLQPWPDPVGGYRLRSYSLNVPPEPGRFGKIFRCTTFMVNFMDASTGPRDTTKLSPHSHDDFEQCSLVFEGEYIHHIRFPWTSNLAAWLDDDHTRIGGPSIAVIPPPSIHTSQAIGAGANHLIDIFCPPRVDFSEKPGWVLNADEYPMS